MTRTQVSQIRLVTLACLAVAGLTMGSIGRAACVDPNTCFGTGTLQQHVSGTDNSAFGFRALGADLNGIENTAVGAYALSGVLAEILEGHFHPQGQNTAVGSRALISNTTGNRNIAIGASALQRNTTGHFNVGVGAFTLDFNTTGLGNVAVGERALWNNTTGRENIAIGNFAMPLNGSGSGNIAIGAGTMIWEDETDPGPGRANGNIAIGSSSMFVAPFGSDNTAVGTSSLSGVQFVRPTGTGNTAIGVKAIASYSSGSFNTATGHSALTSNPAGLQNTAIGTNALFANTNGSYNTANGNNALRNATTGIRNVAVGHRAGFNLTTGSDNIIIGGDNAGLAADSSVIRIGRSRNQKKTFIAGIRGVQTGLAAAATVFIDANGQLGTVKSSRDVKENILPMGSVSERLLSLRPVTFQYKQADEDGSKPIQFGLIAEDVAQSFPELVVYDANGKPETVAYHLLATLLLNEFQAQAARVTALEAQTAELEQARKEFAQMTDAIKQLNLSLMVASAQ